MCNRFLTFAALTLLLPLGCDAGGTTQVGGSTGDPGVTDFTSLDPVGPPQAPPSGACATRPVTQVPREAFFSTGLAPIDPADGLWLDVERGTVVDVSEPAAPRTRGALALGALAHATPLGSQLGSRRLLASAALPPAGVVADDDDGEGDIDPAAKHELLLLDFDDPDAPSVVTRHAIAGEIALVSVRHLGEATHVAVVSDAIQERCVGSTKQSTLHRFAVQDDALEPVDTLALGDNLSLAASFDGLLVLLDGLGNWDGQTHDDPGLRLVDLDAGSLDASAPLPTVGPLGAQPQLHPSLHAGVLTLVAESPEHGGVHVQRVDASDPSAPVMLSDCDAEIALGGAWVVGERIFVATWPAAEGPGTTTNRMLELDAECNALAEREARWMFALPGGERAVELDFSQADAIEARLLGGDAGPPIAELRVELDAGQGPSRPYNGSFLADASPWTQDAGAHLLAIPLDGEAGMLQLLSVSDASLGTGAQLSPGDTLALPLPDGVATLAGPSVRTLSTFALAEAGGGAVTPSGQLDLAPYFERGYLHDAGYTLRFRTARPHELWELEDSEVALAPATLEMLDADEDPERGQARAQLELDPRARLVRVGDLFVSVVNSQFETPGETRIEIFDLADPLEPRARGVLETDALWLQDNDGTLRGPGIECLDCDPIGGDGPFALATGSAIVLRGVRWVDDGDGDGHEAYTFQTIDLSDPDAPALGEVFEMPDEDHGRGAIAAGDSVYYRYVRPLDDDPGRVRFFVRRLSLADPGAPELSDPINLPGNLVAHRGDSLYTLEQVREDETLRMVVHRCTLLQSGAVEVQASLTLGEREVTALQVRGDRVLVDLGARLDAPPPITDGGDTEWLPTALTVLDAETLEPIVDADVAIGASRLGASDSTIVYALWTGVLSVDATAPDDLSLRSFVPFGGPASYAGKVSFADDRALIATHDGGRLFSLEL